MVTNSATFGRSGVHDYILIRATALIMTAYVLYLVGFVAFNDITYEAWTGFLRHNLHQGLHPADALVHPDPRLDRSVAGADQL